MERPLSRSFRDNARKAWQQAQTGLVEHFPTLSQPSAPKYSCVCSTTDRQYSTISTRSSIPTGTRTSWWTSVARDGAAKFMDFMRIAVAEDASTEHVDDFLGSFDVLLDRRVVH
jgi:hypothetical protein